MKTKIRISLIPLMITLLFLGLYSGCSSGKYGEYKGKEYKTAWNQMNDFIKKNNVDSSFLNDIKKDSLLKAALYELVRRSENPEKKSPVETLSKTEEEKILKGWKRVIRKNIHDGAYFVFFKENPEKGAQLLYDSGVPKNEAYNEVAMYLFYEQKDFDGAIAINEKAGMSTQDACKMILEPLSVSGSGGYIFFKDKEEEMIAFLKKAGQSEDQAIEMVASAAAYYYIGNLEQKDPSETEAVKNIEKCEALVSKLTSDPKKTAKIMGEGYFRNHMPFKAAEYLEKSDNQELLKEAYHEMASEYFRKEDFKNALLYYEKAGSKDDLEQLREYLKRTGK